MRDDEHSRADWNTPPNKPEAAAGVRADPSAATRPSAAVSPDAEYPPGLPTGVRGLTQFPGAFSGGTPQIGMVIKKRYTLVEELGRGGMGHVFKARDQLREEADDRNPYVALKVLSEDFQAHPDSFKALQSEIKRAHTLAHPNVITMYDFDRDGPVVYMTMECLEGTTLDVRLKSDFSAGLSVAEAWPFIRGIAAALEYGHSKGIIHSDMKPTNVFLCKDHSVKVLDFGIARRMPSADTTGEVTRFDPGKRLGALTPAYASLEMWLGEPPDPRDDIYSFACVMYELLAGHHPFGGSSAKVVRDNALTPKKIDKLGRAQWDALRRGLALRREDRIPTVSQLVAPFAPRSFLRRHGRSIAAAIVVVTGVGLALTARYYRAYVEDELIGDTPSSSAPRTSAALTPEQRQDVAEKLALAKEFFGDVSPRMAIDDLLSALSEGPNNVNQILEDVLATDGNNPDALGLQSKIVEVYARKAREAADAGDAAGAIRLVRSGLGIRPQNHALFRLEREICRANGVVCQTTASP